MTSISILVPAYNEAANILTILGEVKKQRPVAESMGFKLEIIVIDDGSKDQSVALLRANPDLYDRLIAKEKNGGKGAAVKSGLEAATGEYILFQDADLEYDPVEYKKLFVPLKKFNADLVIGSRTIAPDYLRIHYFWNRMGNALITLTLNILYNRTFTDIYSCYLLYRRSLVHPSELKTMGFEQQAEILGKAVRRARAMYEVPISYHGRTVEEGKKIRPHHIFAILWRLLAERFAPLERARS